MAVKITDVIVTTADEDISWEGLSNKYPTWEQVKNLSDWKDVRHLGIKSPLTVTVGTPIKVTVTAVDIDWDYIKNNFNDWSTVRAEFTNWNSIHNYH